jgi:hypothetical protein
VGARPASPPAKPTEPVVIRSVGWDRIDSTLAELDKEAAASDIAPDDWPPERKAEAHAALLRGLQVQLDPRRVEVLGRSEFATTDDVRPDTDRGRGALEKFAEKIGADTVVWSSRPLGTTDVIEQRPVTTYGSEQAWFQDRGGRWRSSQFTTSETTWVPMHTQADKFAYIAFFMRMKQ